jgi:hypothetical protein
MNGLQGDFPFVIAAGLAAEASGRFYHWIPFQGLTQGLACKTRRTNHGLRKSIRILYTGTHALIIRVAWPTGQLPDGISVLAQSQFNGVNKSKRHTHIAARLAIGPKGGIHGLIATQINREQLTTPASQRLIRISVVVLGHSCDLGFDRNT